MRGTTASYGVRRIIDDVRECDFGSFSCFDCPGRLLVLSISV